MGRTIRSGRHAAAMAAVVAAAAVPVGAAPPPVVVSVSRDYQTILDAPATVRVITRREIRAFHYRSLADVLAAQTGFFTSRNYNHTVGVRGFSVPGDFNSRLLVLYDNHPLTELEFSANPIDLFEPSNALGIDLSRLRQIEILRGPGFQLYGSGAMLAVVNLIPEESVGAGRGAGAAAEIGGLGYEEYAAHAHWGGERGGLSAEWIRRSQRGDDFYYAEMAPVYGEEAARVEGLNHGESTGARLTGDWGGWRITAMAAQTLQEDPSAVFFTVLGEPQSNQNHRAFARLRYLDDLTDTLRLWARLGWDGYLYRARFVYDDEGVPILEKDLAKSQWATGEAQLDWSAPGDHLITFGAQAQSQFQLYQENAFPEEGGTVFRDHRNLHAESAFLKDEWIPVAPLTLSGTLRHERHSRFGGFWGPRAAAVWRPGADHALKLQYGRGFRAPNVYEMHYSDSFFYFGNPDLDPEISDAFDLTHDWVAERWRAQTSLFLNDLRDLIAQADGERIVAGVPTPVLTYANADGARLYGAESVWEWLADAGHRIEASYGLQFNEADGVGDNRLPNSPRHKAAARLLLALDPLGATAAWETIWMSRRLTPAGTRVDPLTLSRAVLRWEPEGGPLAFSGGADNLFDARYDTPATGDHEQTRLPQSGRTLFLRAEAEF